MRIPKAIFGKIIKDVSLRVIREVRPIIRQEIAENVGFGREVVLDRPAKVGDQILGSSVL